MGGNVRSVKGEAGCKENWQGALHVQVGNALRDRWEGTGRVILRQG